MVSPAIRFHLLFEAGEDYQTSNFTRSRNHQLMGIQSTSFFNHPEIELLPEDMIAFFDEHEKTDPQLELTMVVAQDYCFF